MNFIKVIICMVKEQRNLLIMKMLLGQLYQNKNGKIANIKNKEMQDTMKEQQHTFLLINLNVLNVVNF